MASITPFIPHYSSLSQNLSTLRFLFETHFRYPLTFASRQPTTYIANLNSRSSSRQETIRGKPGR